MIRPVNLYLFRHAAAVPPSDPSLDRARPLSEKGRTRFASVVEGLESAGIVLDHVHHSPLVRAVQTAELLMPITVETEAPTTTEQSWLAEAPTPALLRSKPVTQTLVEDDVAWVGHEPWIREIAAIYLTANKRAANAFPFRKGTMLWLEGNPRPGQMQLKAALPPRLSRLMD